ncbi:hypothetical protein [Deinococcus aquaedulcis]|uniref:hypothetical protein n=1 Tax=Deinococcus aquaedulcis TaxID=2840455 RepID=UPI001C830831|nr:hypothetical protein [Deinococcus aquaedulcis]
MTLNQALDRLYDVFGQVPKPATLDACSCCMDDTEIRFILREPLRTLTASHLSSYASSALYTVGGWDDFRYFLPRLLELAVQGEWVWPDAELICKRVQYGLDEGYVLSGEEARALSAFQEAWWRWTLAHLPDQVPLSVEEVLVAALIGGTPLEDLLADWRTSSSASARWHLALFIKVNFMTLALGKTMNHQLPNGVAVSEALAQWVMAPEQRAWLEEAFFADPDGPAAQDISDALLWLPPQDAP